MGMGSEFAFDAVGFNDRHGCPSCRGYSAQVEQAFDIVSEIGHPDLDLICANPMVRMSSFIRSFRSANTCSTRERFLDFALLVRRIVAGEPGHAVKAGTKTSGAGGL
jgi:hypothetical protein